MPHTSSNIQNQLISILSDHICNATLRKVCSSLCYTLIANEVTDCSNNEQLSIVIRYVEPETASIREDLDTLLECDSGIIDKALADKMLGFVRNHLDPSKMRCQDYDGAAARISSQYPLALYTHCTSHCLNLAVVASFKEVSVRHDWRCEATGIFFFAHPKCQKKLKEAIQNTQPESNVLKLKDLFITRWIEWIDALDHIKKLYTSIVACFENIFQLKVLACGILTR